MTNMIERMARAVCEQNTEYNGPKDSRTLQQRVDEEWPNWIDSANAALRELLQPTEGMLIAANKGPGKPTNAVASGIWVRMAQAALEGE